MHCTERWIRRAVLATLAVALTSSAVQAQSITFAGAAEAAGDKVYVLFGELGLAAAGTGIRPVASLSAHKVFTEGTDGWGVTPAAGLRYNTEGGFIQGKVGYAFRDDKGNPFFGGNDNGVYGSFQTEYWGSGDVSASGIVSYNFGADYLWSRARLGKTIGSFGDGGSWGLGGELVWQGQTSETSAGFDGPKTTQVGPVLMFTTREGGPNFSVSGGWKQNKVGISTTANQTDDTWYLKGEIYVP